MMRAKPRLTLTMLCGYCIVFFAAWTLREFYLRQQMLVWLGEVGGTVMNTCLKLMMWTLPAALFIWQYEDDLEVPRLFANRANWGRVGWIVALMAAYNVISAVLNFGQLRIHPNFRMLSLLGTVIFVGVTEETVFRGFLLNALLKMFSKRAAMIISSVLFVLIHFPIWYTKGMFVDVVLLLRSCLTIFVLGMIFADSFIRERNLAAPIVLHMAWNLFALLLFGQ